YRRDPARLYRLATSHRLDMRERLGTSALWMLILLHGPAPLLEARVDRSRLPTGEQLTLTVRARSRTAEPVSLTLPALTGFTIVGSREVTDVSLDGAVGQWRTTTRELRLRT